MLPHEEMKSTDEEPDDLIGLCIADKYDIVERIGAGAHGVVYRARQRALGRDVAVKVLHRHLAREPEFVAAFRQEAMTTARVKHPNTVAILDMDFTDEGVIFMVMEYLHGRTLTQVIRTSHPLPLAQVIDITAQILRALEEIHAAGIVHADLKSDNIIIEELHTADVVKILDFSIARIVTRPLVATAPDTMDPDETGEEATTQICGTPGYMAPEVILGRKPSPSCDVYSAGIVLYHLLTGKPPFSGKTPQEVMRQQLHSPLVPPSRTCECRDIPASLEEVLLRATACNPLARYKSARQFLQSLESVAMILVPGALAQSVCRSNMYEPCEKQYEIDDDSIDQIPSRNADSLSYWKQLDLTWPTVSLGPVAKIADTPALELFESEMAMIHALADEPENGLVRSITDASERVHELVPSALQGQEHELEPGLRARLSPCLEHDILPTWSQRLDEPIDASVRPSIERSIETDITEPDCLLDPRSYARPGASCSSSLAAIASDITRCNASRPDSVSNCPICAQWNRILQKICQIHDSGADAPKP